jgi:hypothetical protein
VRVADDGHATGGHVDFEVGEKGLDLAVQGKLLLVRLGMQFRIPNRLTLRNKELYV